MGQVNREYLRTNMKTLITGRQGYIGSHLYSQLEEQSSVTSIDYGNGPTEKDFISLDLTNINKVNDFADNCDHFDVLIFLVGFAHTKGKVAEFSKFKCVNYQTLFNLLIALQKQNKLPKQIIFSSSISVYGERYHQRIYNETIEQRPFSPYAVTKLMAERFLLENFNDRSWILRFAPVYSPDFFLNVNRRTKIGDRFFKVGSGAKKLSLCNIENIKVSVTEIIKGNIPPGVYNLSDLKDYTYNELLNWQKASSILRIPIFAVRLLFYLGKLTDNIFLKENSIKLITDNIFPSDKIRLYIDLPATINDVKLGND